MARPLPRRPATDVPVPRGEITCWNGVPPGPGGGSRGTGRGDEGRPPSEHAPPPSGHTCAPRIPNEPEMGPFWTPLSAASRAPALPPAGAAGSCPHAAPRSGSLSLYHVAGEAVAGPGSPRQPGTARTLIKCPFSQMVRSARRPLSAGAGGSVSSPRHLLSAPSSWRAGEACSGPPGSHGRPVAGEGESGPGAGLWPRQEGWVVCYPPPPPPPGIPGLRENLGTCWRHRLPTASRGRQSHRWAQVVAEPGRPPPSPEVGPARLPGGIWGTCVDPASPPCPPSCHSAPRPLL